MPPETPKLLHDMQTAAQDIADSSAGRTYELFLLDKQLRMAIERAFEIVGQALTKLHKIDPSTATSITDWRAIMGFRNVLIHGYAIVDPAKTWDNRHGIQGAAGTKCQLIRAARGGRSAQTFRVFFE